MKNKLKKIVSVGLSCITLAVCGITSVGCNKKERVFVEKGEELIFMASVLPAFTDDAFETMAELGLDVVGLNEWQCGPTSSELQRTVMRLCAKHGLKYYPHLANAGVSDSFSGDDELYVYDYSKDLELYENMHWIAMADEPHYKHFDQVASWIPRYEKTYIAKPFYVNLFPEYVSDKELGGLSYNKYVKTFCDNILKKLNGEKWLVFDYYPYAYNEDSQTPNGMFYSWLHNLAIMQTNLKTIENGHMGAHFQTCSFTGNREVDEFDMRQQLYVNLAFGVENISCYTYAKPVGNELHGEDKKSMIDEDGVPTSIYYAVQKIIAEAKLFDDVYLSYQYDGTKVYYPSETYDKISYNAAFEALADEELTVMLDSFEKISSVYNTQDTVISQFFNKEGKFAYIAVNYEDPIERKSDSVKLKFEKDVKQVKMYRKGIPQTVTLKDNVLEFILEPGEGVMVIPVY